MIPEILKITVKYRGRTVGTIQSDPRSKACVFEYDKTWLANGFSVSPTELPLQGGLFFADKNKFGGGFAVFEDSLPDGYGCYLLDRMLRRQGESFTELTPLQRLAVIGVSGMGALTYQPSLPGLGKQKEAFGAEELNGLQEEALKVLSEKEAGDESLLYYRSANSGGARPKTAYRGKDGTHWLVKFRHVYDLANIGKTEYLYMDTARECGVNIPRIRLMEDRFFAIERFDLSPHGEKLHTLTAAALLKTDFREQGVDYTNLLALTGYLTQDPVQVEEMFRRMVVNQVVINKDDHAKNFSFTCDEGKWSLAPAYDITYSPKGANGEHATSLFYDGNPDLETIIRAGVGIRIPRERCLEIIERVEDVCTKRLKIVHRLTKTNQALDRSPKKSKPKGPRL